MSGITSVLASVASVRGLSSSASSSSARSQKLYNQHGDEIDENDEIVKSAEALKFEASPIQEVKAAPETRTEFEIIAEFERSKPIGKHQMSAKARQLCGMTREQASQVVAVKRFYDLQNRRVEPLCDWRGRNFYGIGWNDVCGEVRKVEKDVALSC